MILSSEAATVLDQAARLIGASDVIPDALIAHGPGYHDSGGYDILSAMLKAYSDCKLLDAFEQEANHPHIALLCEITADFGDVAEQDREIMRVRWEGLMGEKVDLSGYSRRDFRRDDLLQWGRGRHSSHAAMLFRSVADDLRTREGDPMLGTEINLAGPVFTEDDIPALCAKLGPPPMPGGLGEIGDMVQRLMREMFGKDN